MYAIRGRAQQEYGYCLPSALVVVSHSWPAKVHHPTFSRPLLKRIEGENMLNKRLMNGDKDKEITHQLSSRTEQPQSHKEIM